MSKLRVLDLFSGIGGFSLGLERTGGFETVAFCEIEDYPRRVLARHWPEVPCYDDVRTLTANTLRRDGIAVDVICGGFPCQDISSAGNQAGMDGARSGLWSEIARLTGELRPQFVIVENVSALLSGPTEQPGGWFGRVLGDLAALGYDAEWHCIPAASVGAPHRRDRVWIVAYPHVENTASKRCCRPGIQRGLAGRTKTVGASEAVANTEQPGLEGQQRTKLASCAGPRFPIDVGSGRARLGADQWGVEPDVGRVADGVPNRTHRIAALGNAVVPQIPELIGQAILTARAAA